MRQGSPRRAKAAAGAFALGLVAAPLGAHPSWSIVRDEKRDLVFYSDLRQVLSINARFERAVVVPGVRSHELRIDALGNLFGEDAKTNGRYRVWKRAPEGTIADVVPDRPGFRDDYGFVEGVQGALYWTRCSPLKGSGTGSCVVRKRRSDGVVETAARGATFGHPLNYLASMPDGSVLVGDGPDLRRITPTGAVEMYAKQITRSKGRFAFMGFHSLPFGALYVAAYDDGSILRVGPDRVVSVEHRSALPWKPTGVLRTPQGVWILEFDRAFARIRFIDAKGRERVLPPRP